MRKKEAEGCGLIIMIALFGLFLLFEKLKDIWLAYPDYQWIFAISSITILALVSCLLHQQNERRKKERLKRMILLEWWQSLSPREFEYELAQLYKYYGYKVNVTQASRDGGVDIIAKDELGRIYIQCKAYSKPVGVKPVRELYGVMCADGVSRGIVACIGGGFTSGARDFASKNRISLLETYDIIEMSKEKHKNLYEGKI